MNQINMPLIDSQHLFLLFIFYSFVGWICEEIWVSSLYRKIEKRGMLHGPICPIYGFGALIIFLEFILGVKLGSGFLWHPQF